MRGPRLLLAHARVDVFCRPTRRGDLHTTHSPVELFAEISKAEQLTQPFDTPFPPLICCEQENGKRAYFHGCVDKTDVLPLLRVSKVTILAQTSGGTTEIHA